MSDKKQKKKKNTKSAGTDKMALEFAKLGLKDPYIECLSMIAAHYGRRVSPNSLSVGLPYKSNENIGLDLFIRSAKRADLDVRMVQRSLRKLLASPNLPCIAALKNGQACLILSANKNGVEATFPETPGETKTYSYEKLKRLYAGYAFFVRPTSRYDERVSNFVRRPTTDWFTGPIRKNWAIYKDVIFAAIMINIFALATPLFIMNVYDRIIKNSAFESLWVLFIGVVIVFVFDFILKNLRAKFLDVAGRRADVEISSSIFSHITSILTANRPASAGVLASYVRDFETIRDFFTSATLAAFIDLPFIFLFIGVIALIGGPLAFIPLAALPIVFTFALIVQRGLRKLSAETTNETALKNALLFETITGLETIKSHCAEGHRQRDWEELADQASRTAVKFRGLSALVVHFSMLVQQLTAASIIVAGVYLIDSATITMGALIASTMLGSRAIAPVSQMAGLISRYSQTREALQNLDDLMKLPVERPADKQFVSKQQFNGDIAFQKVVFKYPGQTIPALDNITFKIEQGQRVGIIGAVGSGKTTLERLLLNIYRPESGSVQIDSTDVRQIDPGDLRRSIGVVQQSPQLFYGSVRENITMGNHTIPDDAVLEAADLAGVMEFLGESQRGLDTQVGERGEALSGGQRQAVAIARALLYNPPILVLDEPTAAMDPTSENRLCEKLETICDGKTVLLITHKASVLSLVDELMLLDKGHLVDKGPREDIIKKLQERTYTGPDKNKKEGGGS